MKHQELIQPRIQVAVKITTDKANIKSSGFIFIESGTRVMDSLNSHDTFIAFMQEDGEIILLNKKDIVAVIPGDIQNKPIPDHLQKLG